MISEFKLVGLSKTGNGKGIIATCEPLDKEETFPVKIELDEETFIDLWNYCHNNWDEKKIAVVKHDGFYSDNTTPINPVFQHFKIP